MNAEKEKLLNEIIEWTEQYWKVALESGNLSRFEHSESGMRWNDGRMAACDDFVAHCKHMMGQNWDTPLVVAMNQSEDTKKSSVSEPLPHDMGLRMEFLPHDMGLRVELDTNEAYYLKSGWKERCDGIYGLACGYVDCSEGITWFKDSARIAIMNSHVKLAVPWEEPETETTKQSEDTK